MFCVAVPVNPTELKCKLWELICIGLCLPKFGHWRRPNVFSRKIVHGISGIVRAKRAERCLCVCVCVGGGWWCVLCVWSPPY